MSIGLPMLVTGAAGRVGGVGGAVVGDASASATCQSVHWSVATTHGPTPVFRHARVPAFVARGDLEVFVNICPR